MSALLRRLAHRLRPPLTDPRRNVYSEAVYSETGAFAATLNTTRMQTMSEQALAPILSNQVNELRKFLPLRADISIPDGFVDAMRRMIFQKLVFDLFQGRLDRLNLGQNVDAVTSFFDHTGDAANLALDAP